MESPEFYRKEFLKMARRSLKDHKKSGFKFFTVATYPDACPDCKSQSGKIIEIGKAKIGKNIPPFKFCKNKWCKCSLKICEIPNPAEKDNIKCPKCGYEGRPIFESPFFRKEWICPECGFKSRLAK